MLSSRTMGSLRALVALALLGCGPSTEASSNVDVVPEGLGCASDTDCVVLQVRGSAEPCGVPPAIAVARSSLEATTAERGRTQAEREADAAARQKCLATCKGVECEAARVEARATCVGSEAFKVCRLDRTRAPKDAEGAPKVPLAACIQGTGRPEALAAEGGSCDADHPRACLEAGKKFEADYKEDRGGRLSLLFACEQFDLACISGLAEACDRCRSFKCDTIPRGDQ